MSQHDFNIANQTFPSFRSDLNDALQAAATISAGATAPTTPYAYQLWYDTANEKYMIRNAANSAWLNFVGIDTNGNVDVTGTGTMDRLGLGSAAHASAALLLTTTNQHIRMDNGGELGVIELDSDGKINIWAHGDGETINLKTGSGAGTDVLSVVGSNVGIGTGSPSRTLTVNSGTVNTAMRLESTDQGVAIEMYDGTTTSTIAGGNAGIEFYPSGSLAAKIDTSGNLLLGTTTNPANYKFNVIGRDASNPAAIGAQPVTNGSYALGVQNASGTNVGGVIANASSTSYATSSDHRLKENVVADWDATTRLKQLNPVRFNFISDADTTVDGFLAHEVQTVVPEAITGTHNGMRDEEYQVSAATGDIYTPATDAVLDEDGNEVTPAVAEVIHSTDVERPEELAEGQQWRETTAAVMGTRSVPDYQGIDQSKLVPLLVKTIQELEARITALEA